MSTGAGRLPRACEFSETELGRLSLRKEQSQGFARLIGKVSACLSDLKRTGAMDEGNGQIAHGGHHLRSVAGAQARAILAKGYIAHIVQRIFNTPVMAH